MKRDLSQLQFEYRARKLGFKPDAMGYWFLSDGSTTVCARNAGDRRRKQLEYLIEQDKKHCTPDKAESAWNEANKIAESFISNLERNGWLDFDNCEQTERAIIVNDLALAIQKR